MKDFELDFIRDQFINELQKNPVDNERFTATFYKLTPNGGEVVFLDKITSKEVKAKWGTYKDENTIKATLLYENDFLLLDVDYREFKEKIDEKIIIFQQSI